MLQFFARRVLSTLPTLLGVSLLAFFMIHLVPGDPVMLMLGERGGSAEAVAEMRGNLGLDRPLVNQYLTYVGRALSGDLGESIISHRPVMREFLDRFPATVELSLAAMVFALLVGIPFGVLAAVKRNSWLDHALMGGSLIGYSMPIFWWGLILILVFSVWAGLTPVAGRMNVAFDIAPQSGFLLIDSWLGGDGWPAFREVLRHLVLPSVALGTVPLAAIARMTRSSLLEVLREDYIRTARAKGLSAWQVIMVHALRNALIPIITVVGLMVGSLLTGAILTESIFSWPGIGKWIVHSVTARDYPVIQGGVLLIAVLIMTVNISVDFVYMLVNPHFRESR